VTYAKDTEVPFERSIAEIVGLVRKAGADQIGQMEERQRFTLQFLLEDRVVRFRVSFLSEAEIQDMRGPRQDPARLDAQWRRQRARALLLVIKAKLESVASGVETFEQAFLANVVMADDRTVYERISAPIAAEYEAQRPSQLLMGGPSE
jgi:hypothetical protein